MPIRWLLVRDPLGELQPQAFLCTDLKYGQFASYYVQMRACVKYFADVKGAKVIGSMYQDTDFGKDCHAGVVAQVEAMKLKLGGIAASRPNAQVTRLKEAGCDLVCMGTIVRDTIIILQTAHEMGWDVDFCGQFATYSTAARRRPVNRPRGSIRCRRWTPVVADPLGF